MIKLPILSMPDTDQSSCTFSETDHAFTVHNTPGFPECSAVVSAVTGGFFTDYLQEMKESAGALCIFIQPLHHAFPLPSYSGCGELIAMDKLQSITNKLKVHISESLMCRYCYDHGSHTVILFDDEQTLCEKAAAAGRVGYQYLLGEESILKKIKTP